MAAVAERVISERITGFVEVKPLTDAELIARKVLRLLDEPDRTWTKANIRFKEMAQGFENKAGIEPSERVEHAYTGLRQILSPDASEPAYIWMIGRMPDQALFAAVLAADGQEEALTTFVNRGCPTLARPELWDDFIVPVSSAAAQIRPASIAKPEAIQAA